MTLAPHERDKRKSHKQRKTEQDDIDRNGIVVERLVGCGVKGGLRKVEEASETDDEPVDFAKGSEAEDFGGVVAVKMLAMNVRCNMVGGDLRNSGVIKRSVEYEEHYTSVCRPGLGNYAQHTDSGCDGHKE